MHISIDMVTGLPDSHGHDAILMIVDRFSKAIIPVACNIELSAEGWARILRDHVYAKHGMPQVIISDRGPQFVSQFMKDSTGCSTSRQTCPPPFTCKLMDRPNE